MVGLGVGVVLEVVVVGEGGVGHLGLLHSELREGLVGAVVVERTTSRSRVQPRHFFHPLRDHGCLLALEFIVAVGSEGSP